MVWKSDTPESRCCGGKKRTLPALHYIKEFDNNTMHIFRTSLNIWWRVRSAYYSRPCVIIALPIHIILRLRCHNVMDVTGATQRPFFPVTHYVLKRRKTDILIRRTLFRLGYRTNGYNINVETVLKRQHLIWFWYVAENKVHGKKKSFSLPDWDNNGKKSIHLDQILPKNYCIYSHFNKVNTYFKLLPDRKIAWSTKFEI